MNKNNISTLEHERCTGCCACENICPVEAITMVTDSEGFIFPKVNNEKCVDCGVCSKRCPVLNPLYLNRKSPECYAVMANNDIRSTSASGGIFTAFAKIILSRGGVVCGAALNDNFTVSHIVCEDEKLLESIRNTKYMQSEVGYTLKRLLVCLNKGKEVLFCGCPCQVAGLYAFLGRKKYDNLYTMDLVCHGVPSSKVFNILCK